MVTLTWLINELMINGRSSAAPPLVAFIVYRNCEIVRQEFARQNKNTGNYVFFRDVTKHLTWIFIQLSTSPFRYVVEFPTSFQSIHNKHSARQFVSVSSQQQTHRRFAGGLLIHSVQNMNKNDFGAWRADNTYVLAQRRQFISNLRANWLLFRHFDAIIFMADRNDPLFYYLHCEAIKIKPHNSVLGRHCGWKETASRIEALGMESLECKITIIPHLWAP